MYAGRIRDYADDLFFVDVEYVDPVTVCNKQMPALCIDNQIIPSDVAIEMLFRDDLVAGILRLGRNRIAQGECGDGKSGK